MHHGSGTNVFILANLYVCVCVCVHNNKKIKKLITWEQKDGKNKGDRKTRLKNKLGLKRTNYSVLWMFSVIFYADNIIRDSHTKFRNCISEYASDSLTF